MFQGKRKYFAIGAVVLVVVIALIVSRNRSSGSASAARTGLDPNTIAPGAAAPGLTMADVQGAIDKYGEKDMENTQKMFDSLNGSFNDALTKQAEGQSNLWNKMLESNNKQFEAIGKQFEGIGKQFEGVNNSLVQINDNNAKMQQGLWESLQRSLADMEASFASRYARYNTPDPYYGSSSSSGSSSSGSSSSGSSTPLQQNQNNYDKREGSSLTPDQKATVDYNRGQVDKYAENANKNGTWSPSNPLFKA